MSIKQKLISLILLLALITCSMFGVTWCVAKQQKDDGLVINLAGRQRMLIQKMMKETLMFHSALVKDEKYAKQIMQTIAVFDKTLSALKDSGNAPLDINLDDTEYRYCPRATGLALAQLGKVQGMWKVFSEKIESVIEDRSTADENIRWILKNNMSLLKEIDVAVVMMQKQSEAKVNFLIILQIVAVAVSGCFVLFAVMVVIRVTNDLNAEIVERKEAEKELREYREKMFRAEQLASLGTIGSALAHQLNQPLSVIRMSIQKTLRNLRKTDCSDIIKEMLDDSLDQVSVASSVVKGFLALGHTSSKGNISNIDIYKTVIKTTAIFNEMAKNIKIKLIIDDSLKKMPTIKGIAGEIEQMFFILVQNAIQAANANKRQWFKISGNVKEEQIELTFSDNCGGIEPENLDKIFEPFFTTKPADQGTGLGLAILQQIVTNHNGTVRVDSEFGQETTFYITFPIKR